jgi:hypothetical protein
MSRIVLGRSWVYTYVNRQIPLASIIFRQCPGHWLQIGYKSRTKRAQRFRRTMFLKRTKMKDSKPAYQSKANPKLIVDARQVGIRASGVIDFEPDIKGPIDVTEWVAGVVDSNGEFHPSDRAE